MAPTCLGKQQPRRCNKRCSPAAVVLAVVVVQAAQAMGPGMLQRSHSCLLGAGVCCCWHGLELDCGSWCDSVWWQGWFQEDARCHADDTPFCFFVFNMHLAEGFLLQGTTGVPMCLWPDSKFKVFHV
jgi:hypothetical protein